MTEAGWRLEGPDGFIDDADWELIVSRGLLMGGRLVHGERKFPVIVYDPYRLTQDLEAETHDGGIFYEPNVISVENLSRETAETTVSRLAAAGFLDWMLG